LRHPDPVTLLPIGEFAARGILFDLDGTLVDSAPDLIGACNRMLKALGASSVDPARARGWIGNGARRLVEQVLADGFSDTDPAELMDQAYPLFEQFYQEDLCRDSVLYPGAQETLARLHQAGKPLACVTNKPAVFARPLLEGLGVTRYFDPIIGGGDLPCKKPDPLPLQHVADQWALAPTDCVLVGDSISDFRAARACGMPVILVNYGYSQGLDLAELGADAVIDSFAQVTEIIQLSEE